MPNDSKGVVLGIYSMKLIITEDESSLGLFDRISENEDIEERNLNIII